MKKIVFLICFITLPAICFSQPSIVFDSAEHDLGEITQGDVMRHTFEFINSGDEDLLIGKLSSS
jgi:hypothetical protein